MVALTMSRHTVVGSCSKGGAGGSGAARGGAVDHLIFVHFTLIKCCLFNLLATELQTGSCDSYVIKLTRVQIAYLPVPNIIFC